MTISVLALINGLLCTAICIRLLTYQRGTSKHRPLISAFAAVLVFASGGEAMLCLIGAERCVTLPQVLLTACMSVSVFAHRGNVSRCLPMSKEKRKALKLYSLRIGF
jgi:hypothetical protein